jgi:tetratricopeptide (TPR) repeat protein
LRVIDVYDVQTGIYATDRLRWAGIQESGVSSEDNGQWLAAFSPAANGHLLNLKTLISQDILKNGSAAFETIKALPEALRNSPPLYALEYAALRNSLDDPKKGLTDEMKARFLSLLTLAPSTGRNTPESHQMLAELFMKDGRQPEAEAELLKAYAKFNDGYLQYLLSKWRLEKGDVAGATEAYLQAKKDAPHLSQLFNHGKALDAKKSTP